jgi:hypothetical protein
MAKTPGIGRCDQPKVAGSIMVHRFRRISRQRITHCVVQPTYSAAMLAPQVIALHTELQRPKPL